ncbi:MAG: c-type cytochrome, partial [Chloroflexaceae bacterium]
MHSLRVWRTGGLLVTVLLVASILAGCSAGPSTAALLDPPPPVSPSPIPSSDDSDLGRQLFAGQITVPGFVACIGCHSIDPAGRAGIGPNLAAVGQVAGQRVPGMTAAEYIERSIRFHDEFVVPGYSPGIARGALGGRDFDEVLSDAQVLALVDYLMSLPASPAGANPTSGVAAAHASTPSGAARPAGRVSATLTATASPTASTTASPTSG